MTGRTEKRGAERRFLADWERERSRKKGACVRDPRMGPGNCGYWWDGCPNPEKRVCFQDWKKAWMAGPSRGASA